MEKIIDSHPAVQASVVVGIPHPYKKQVPVACIVLKDNIEPSDELTNDIKAYCSQSIAKYSMPYRYEYIKSVPKTLIGKINYKKLEEEEVLQSAIYDIPHLDIESAIVLIKPNKIKN